jgi:hypothetical protein
MKIHVIKVYRGAYSDELALEEYKRQKHRNDRPPPWAPEDKLQAWENHPLTKELAINPIGKVEIELLAQEEELNIALISYDSVCWSFTPIVSRKISVYLSSYHPSEIETCHSGIKTIRRYYDYRNLEPHRREAVTEKEYLIAIVEKDTGYHVGSFQEAYEGQKFIIY